MKKLTCYRWEEFINELQSESDEAVDRIVIMSRFLQISKEDAHRVAEAIVKCKRKCGEKGLKLHFQNISWSADEFKTILHALTENDSITQWWFGGDLTPKDLDVCCISMILAMLREAPHVHTLDVYSGLEMSENFMRDVAQVMLDRPVVHQLWLPATAFEYPEVIAAMVCLRTRFPYANLVCPGKHQRRHKSVLAKLAVHNKVSLLAIQSLQRQLLDAFVSGNLAHAMDIFHHLTQEVVFPEHKRMLALLPELSEMNCLIGGMEMCSSLPIDFDENASKDATGQYIPKPLSAFSSDAQVSFLVGCSRYKQLPLKLVIADMEQAVAPLERLFSWVDDTSACVENLLRTWKLLEVTCELPSYKVTSGHGDKRNVSGEYVMCGYQVGCPIFARTDGGQFLLRAGNNLSWVFRNHIDTSAQTCQLLDESHGKLRIFPKLEDGDHAKWDQNYNPVIEDGELHQRSLKDAVVEFLMARPKWADLLEFGDSVMRVKLGPLKGKDRAQEKGPKWLLDLNRCTFVFESPAIMVLAFFIFKKIVEDAGGRIVRFNNYFFEDGRLSVSMTKPPCLHVNFMIEGWTYEAMFSLQVFVNVKEVMHKYYEILRCKNPVDLLIPVFNPMEADESIVEQLHDNLLGLKTCEKAATDPVASAEEQCAQCCGSDRNAASSLQGTSSKRPSITERIANMNSKEKEQIDKGKKKEEEKEALEENNQAEEDIKKLQEEIKQLQEKAEKAEAKRKAEEKKALEAIKIAETKFEEDIKQLQKKAETEEAKRKEAEEKALEEKTKFEEEIKRLQMKAGQEEAKRKEEEKKALEAKRAAEEEKMKFKQAFMFTSRSWNPSSSTTAFLPRRAWNHMESSDEAGPSATRGWQINAPEQPKPARPTSARCSRNWRW